MNYLLLEACSYSIVPAAVIALFRYRKAIATDRPFLYVIWASLLNEIVSSIAINAGLSNAFNSNIYVLVEWWLLIWLFYNWTRNKKRKWHYLYGGIIASIVWGYDNFFAGNMYMFNSLLRIVYSFILVLIAIDRMNALIVLERRNIVANPGFIICSAIIVFFSYKATIELLYLLRLNVTKAFQSAIYQILVWVNVLCNILYTIAILCLHRKRNFTWHY
jgi:hypothetical protein